MQRILLLLIILLAHVVSGCGSSQTIKDSWKFTTRQYRTYLNTPASIDFDDKGSCEVYEVALGDAVLKVDENILALIRAMENSDHNPGPPWVMSMMQRFPWLSGVALVDGDGVLNAQYPEYFAKTFDASPLLEADQKQRMGELRAYVQMDPAGPEVYVANPVFGQDKMRGIIVAYFDPRALVMYSSDPGSFMIASPAGVVWPGNFSSGSPVSSTDWATLLTSKSCGIVGSEGNEFFWTSRYIGNLPLVYAMPTSSGRFPEAQPDAAPQSPQAQGGQLEPGVPSPEQASPATPPPAPPQAFEPAPAAQPPAPAQAALPAPPPVEYAPLETEPNPVPYLPPVQRRPAAP
ncbi:hypothetical protein LJC59_07235 [Desulfovibrio sp. OttesenSCG-928-A18]|nr:hypothetical protein [Desulfovibrio sp. OttesenSCG-928-A18]